MEFIILLKSYVSTEAPISYITRNNTGERDWNPAWDTTAKDLSQHAFYHLKHTTAVSMNSYVFVMWNSDELDWVLSSQVFTCSKANSIKIIRTSDWKKVKYLHVRCLNWLYLSYQSSSYNISRGEESPFLFHLRTCQSAVFSKSI